VFERSLAIALGLAVLGCTDDERLASWRIRVVELEAPKAFDPRIESVTLAIRIDVERIPASSLVRAEFSITQSGGIPVRTLSDTKHIHRAGEVELEVEWDGTDRTGVRLPLDVFEATIDVVLARESGEILSDLRAAAGRQTRKCVRDELCVIVRSCEAERCDVPVAESDFVCSVVGAFMPPPPLSSWNFSGTDDVPPIKLPFATGLDDRYPANAPAGGNPSNGSNPVVTATDLGSPFEHTTPNGEKQLVFLFGDTEPVPEKSYAHDTDGNVFPTGSVFSQLTANDDALALSSQSADDPPIGPDRCLDLGFVRGGSAIDPVHGIAESKLIAPITMDGPLTADVSAWTLEGINLGFFRVPGPGFSLDGKIFTLMPADNDPSIGVGCDSAHPCAPGDQCLPSGACFYGDCSALDGSTACFRRKADATLAVQSSGAEFRSPLASEYDPGALDIYAQQADLIPGVAFHVPSQGELYVWARDTIVGHPDAPSRLYFWRHPIHGASGERRIGRPEVFVGCDDDPSVCDVPKFSTERDDKIALYAEDRLIANQTSITYLAELDRWIMIYGGRLPIWTHLLLPPVTEERALEPYAGVYLRTANHAWGPWSSAITIYNPYWNNVAGYCDILYFAPTQAAKLDQRIGAAFVETTCSASDPVQASMRFLEDFGAEYGTAIVPRFVEAGPDYAAFFWLMSTWNPYRVVLMKTKLSKR